MKTLGFNRFAQFWNGYSVVDQASAAREVRMRVSERILGIQGRIAIETGLSEFRHMLDWTRHPVGRRLTKGRVFPKTPALPRPEARPAHPKKNLLAGGSLLHADWGSLLDAY